MTSLGRPPWWATGAGLAKRFASGGRLRPPPCLAPWVQAPPARSPSPRT